jgi:hypothetical protein
MGKPGSGTDVRADPGQPRVWRWGRPPTDNPGPRRTRVSPGRWGETARGEREPLAFASSEIGQVAGPKEQAPCQWRDLASRFVPSHQRLES